MEIYSTPPYGLEVFAWISVAIAFASTLLILYDIYIKGYRQKMGIMEAVYPITALYFGPLAVWFYLKYGRMKSTRMMGEHDQMTNPEKVSWEQISEGASHCGAGCTLGDIIASWIVFGAAWTIAGKALYADFILDFIFAWTLGILFQYFTIVPMKQLGQWEGIWESIKADTFSIISFQVGLFFGMYIYQEWFFSHPLPKTTASYWFFMQVSMILGFFTTYPVNKWLIKRGIKIAM